MSIERTASNLAEFCKQVLGAPYWYGTFGQKANRSLYNTKKSQYSQYYPPKSWTEASFVDDFGKRVTDCAGLIKWFLWSDSMANKSPTYKASEDWGATTFYSKCTSKGKIGSLPAQKVGILVFNGNDSKKNHVGVIVDNDGTVIEAKGHAYGTVKSKASSWGYWGKCNLIKYEETPPAKDTYTVVTQYQPLTLRKEPTTKSDKIGALAKGSTFTSTNVVKGESVKGCDAWVGVNGGYANGYYLSPTPVIKEELKPEEPLPHPEPEPVTPVYEKYKVKTITGEWLALRCAPNTKATLIIRMDNGSVVELVKTVTGEKALGSNEWAYVSYTKNGRTYQGYCVKSRLKKA